MVSVTSQMLAVPCAGARRMRGDYYLVMYSEKREKKLDKTAPARSFVVVPI